MHAWWKPDPSKWIFRGHGAANWRLLARAQRGKEQYAGFGVDAELSAEGFSDQINIQSAERTLFFRFRQALDEAGLEIPVPAPKLDSHPEIRHQSEVPEIGLPLLALAQHYGLPTTLLDWTHHATKAAYFAAAAALERDSNEQKLAIWALRIDAIDAGVYSYMADLRLVTAPMASNPNLHAQSGLFTQARNGQAIAVDDYLRDFLSRHPELESSTPLPWMRKVSAPRSCAPNLLRLLALSGINGSSMFPGYEGAVKRLRKEASWKNITDGQ
jgi:hypothetical protein